MKRLVNIQSVPKESIHILRKEKAVLRALLERQPCFHHFLWLSCLSHGDAGINLIIAIFWANVLLHISTVIQFNFEEYHIDNSS